MIMELIIEYINGEIETIEVDYVESKAHCLYYMIRSSSTANGEYYIPYGYIKKWNILPKESRE